MALIAAKKLCDNDSTTVQPLILTAKWRWSWNAAFERVNRHLRLCCCIPLSGVCPACLCSPAPLQAFQATLQHCQSHALSISLLPGQGLTQGRATHICIEHHPPVHHRPAAGLHVIHSTMFTDANHTCQVLGCLAARPGSPAPFLSPCEGRTHCYGTSPTHCCGMRAGEQSWHSGVLQCCGANTVHLGFT